VSNSVRTGQLQQDVWCQSWFELGTFQQDSVVAGLNWALPNRIGGVTTDINWDPKYKAKELKIQTVCRVNSELLQLIHLACHEFYNALLHTRQRQQLQMGMADNNVDHDKDKVKLREEK
jgi:hypothetical protein